MNHQPFFLLTPFVLFLLSATTYCEASSLERHENLSIVDKAMFQANLGWGDFKTHHSTFDMLDSNKTPYAVNYNASGVHIALDLADFEPLPSKWYIGARIGAQFFSNLKSTITIPTPESEVDNDISQSYRLQLPNGLFSDLMAVKTFNDNPYYLLGFLGAEYDRYQFEGFRNFSTTLSKQVRNNRFWSAGARAGAGIGILLNDRLILGIEYTHRFDQSIHVPAIGDHYPYESRQHTINLVGDNVDLTILLSLC
jgi:hypothetical protein